jgi:hypothetical protein
LDAANNEVPMKSSYFHWLLLLASSAITAASAGPGFSAQDQNRIVEVGGLKSRVPTNWAEVPPDDPHCYKQYRLEPIQDDSAYARVVICPVGKKTTAADLVKRWKAMFLPPQDETMDQAAKVGRLTVNGARATYVEIRGDYKGVPGDPVSRRENYGLLAVYLNTPKGPYVIRMLGPATTVKFYRSAFEEWVKGFK